LCDFAATVVDPVSLSFADATLTESTPSTPGFAPGGGGNAGGSRLTVATVVIEAVETFAGVAVSFWLGSGTVAESDAVFTAPALTVKVFTGVGLIGAV